MGWGWRTEKVVVWDAEAFILSLCGERTGKVFSSISKYSNETGTGDNYNENQYAHPHSMIMIMIRRGRGLG